MALSFDPRPSGQLSHSLFRSLFLTVVFFISPVGGLLVPSDSVHAQDGHQVIDLTLETMVDLALSSSYRVRQLNLSIDRTRYGLQAQQARLKSRVGLQMTLPAFNATSEPKWNSTLQKDEIVSSRRQVWEGELSVRQPLIFFGFPTNGYLSFNNRMYRMGQRREDGTRDVDYYNRYYIRYVQPFFQPNRLKNDLEEAELNLEDSELNFQDDVVGMVGDLSEDYYDLFEDAYTQVISQSLVENLEAALTAAESLASVDSTRSMEVGQVRVELANAREQLQQAESSFRLAGSYIKTTLGLQEADTITLDPVLDLEPVEIDPDEAVSFAMERTPRLRQLGISRREGEISLDETKGYNSFRMDVSVSYGREMYQPEIGLLWDDPENSYTVNVNAYLPLWDWGERKARIEASKIRLSQTDIRREEAEIQIVSNVRNEVRNVEEYQNRTLAMQENLSLAQEISASSLDRYAGGEILVLDLIQSLRRESDTAENFLDTYLGWKLAILRLQELTFHDYETGAPVLERFGVQ